MKNLLLAAMLLPLLAAGGRGADVARRIEFDLAGGDADTALRQFADQSGQQVIYPTELVRNITTHPVKDRLPAKEAIDLMLAGTGLSVWQDPQTGALAIGRLALATPEAVAARPRTDPRSTATTPGPTPERTVQLPPYVVDEKSGAQWRYASVAGVEVLSRCSDAVTTHMIEQHYSLHQLLSLILPESLQFYSDVSSAYLFFGEKSQSAVSPELLTTLQRREVENAATSTAHEKREGAPVTVTVLPNFRFWDQDALATFFLWDEANVTYGQLRLTPSYVRFLLERRAPALPRWFVDGIQDLYGSATLHTVPLHPPSLGIDTPFEAYGVTIHPATWISPEATRELAKKTEGRVEMLTLEDLFSPAREIGRRIPLENEEESPDIDHPSNEVVHLPEFVVEESKLNSGEARARLLLRRSEAELFLRWILASGKPARMAALKKYVERSAVETVSEALFKECFGLSYADAETELQAYVRIACRDEIVLHPDTLPLPDPVELREATAAEVSRIRGGFSRLEVRYVQQVYPELTSRYVAQARRVLRASYDKGDRDPRLLAELGLCECDAGNDTDARPFLEAAVQGRVLRPRAYYELSRIRFASFCAPGPDTKLTVSQLGAVLGPLYQMRRQKPALGEAYELMAEAWLRTDSRPASEHLGLLDEGTKLFSRRPRLLFSVALINARQGRVTQAQALIERGLRVAVDAAMKDQFQKLQAALAAQRAEPGK